MPSPPHVPQFGQAPIIGQRQQQAVAQVTAAMAQLSMAIYTHIIDRHGIPFDPEMLRKLAKDSQVAARAYFEGIGVIQQQGDGT